MRRGGIFAIFYMLFGGIKEKCETSIPAENWANKKLMHRDSMNGNKFVKKRIFKCGYYSK